MLNPGKMHEHEKIKKPQESFGHPMRELFAKNVVTLTPEDTAFDAARVMLEKHIGDIVVVESKEKKIPVGVVTDRDIVVQIVAKKEAAEKKKLSQIMSKKVITATENSSISELVRTMTNEGVSRLPIVDESGVLKGILTSKRLFQYLSQGLCELSALSIQQQIHEGGKLNGHS